MAKKKFSDLPATTSIGASDLLATSQVDADAQSGYTSKKITGGNVARSINAGIEYPTDLETEDKTIIGAVNEINSKALAIDSASGDIASFDTAISAPLVSLSTTIIARGGGGTPSTPIPIVGYSDVNLTRCGVNFTDFSDNTIAVAGYVIGPAPQYINGEHFYLPSGKYTFSFDITNATYPNACQIIIYGNGIEVTRETKSGISQSGKITITFTANAEFNQMLLYCNSSTGGSFSNFQMEVGSTAHSYEPYNGQIITISLGQTVYGGRLYFDNGWKCDVTHGYANIADLDFTPSTPASHIFRTDSIGSLVDAPTTNDDITTAISSCFKAMDFSSISGSDDGKFAIAGKNYAFIGRLVLIDHRYSTVEDFIAGNSTTQIIYPLVTPFTLDLSSSDMLDAVVSKNNVFSDCGVTSLTFIDKMQHYVDKKIAELQALILQ